MDRLPHVAKPALNAAMHDRTRPNRPALHQTHVWQTTLLGHSSIAMQRTGKFLLIASGVVVLIIAWFYIYIGRPINDGRTPAERQQIADACFVDVRTHLQWSK